MIKFSYTVCNKYNSYKNGDDAEQDITKTYFSSIGVTFNKIEPIKGEKGTEKTPDGYLSINGENIALIEVKFIAERSEGRGKQGEFEKIKTDDAIRRQIKNAKKQLGNIESDLPKIIYLTNNEIFFDPDDVVTGAFGKLEIHFIKDVKLYETYRGLSSKPNENLFSDNLISGIISYQQIGTNHSKTLDYNLWIIENKETKSIPKVLFDNSHLKFHLEYSSERLKILKGKEML